MCPILFPQKSFHPTVLYWPIANFWTGIVCRWSCLTGVEPMRQLAERASSTPRKWWRSSTRRRVSSQVYTIQRSPFCPSTWPSVCFLNWTLHPDDFNSGPDPEPIRTVHKILNPEVSSICLFWRLNGQLEFNFKRAWNRTKTFLNFAALQCKIRTVLPLAKRNWI